MRRIERMVAAAEDKSRKALVQAISHQTCLKNGQVYNLLGALDLKAQISRYLENEEPQPSVLVAALRAPDPVALARKAIEEQWTAEQVRVEASRLKAANGYEPPLPPVGQFHTVVVDPPWTYGNTSGRHGPDYSPRMMTLEQVAAGQYGPTWNIREHFAEDFCHLYLWVTDAYLGDCYSVVREWGFEPKTSLVWVKNRIGMGNYYRHQHELCIFAVKGRKRLKRMDTSTVFKADVGKHSEKPDAFYRLVKSCSWPPYLDVFARQGRPGWEVYGDEVTAEPRMEQTEFV